MIDAIGRLDADDSPDGETEAEPPTVILPLPHEFIQASVEPANRDQAPGARHANLELGAITSAQ
jgi:hypothetical protein